MTKEEFMNLGVGETFVFGYREFTVIENDPDLGCEGCYFNEDYRACGDLAVNEAIPECTEYLRKDEKRVIFVEVEK